MNAFRKVSSWYLAPELTRSRLWFAFIVAGVTDATQLLLGPLGWIFLDDALDVLAMILISGAIGFHMLLLPTFVLELLPVTDMLPTWTGCTAAVVFLRRQNQSQPQSLPTKMAQVSPPPVISEGGSPEAPPGEVPPKL